MSIEIVNVTKQFGSFTALDNVNLAVPSGELTALLGPSGSGKTTLLRIIAGLEAPDAGSIRFDGEETTDRHVRERQVGFVFQHYALFRHMTVEENVAFGLTVKPRRERRPKKEIRERVHELLRLVQLEGLADRFPSQLSGGQRQRVALARALAVEPKVLLLDEPFGALDAKVRVELRRWLRRLHDEIHVTSVFVTHDQEEALEVADRIVVMNRGRIEQVGTPAEVYDQPANPFVFDFLGSVNLFHCRAEQGQARAASPDLPMGYVRSHDIEVERSQTADAVEAEVRHIQAVGPAVRVELLVRGTGKTVEAELSRTGAERLALSPGETVYARPRRIQTFVEDYQI
ncbi:sulfate/molybdate ABC transporter ATP-binding protein [Geobacter sulfurreducens]|uniref:sulfate/molybdate ABC transporter ATP-binding protein n=1 Tax=Geobacter sulfurreducens TaxID=35554 RepID=UPI0001D8F270|nr:sulfate ABC transporter ATP-binding protein [Geobacter sulfurreducens]ADI84183.1 sulfate ABC transporter, ATP-binding protein [Geobacter sulfurreducens KN400]AJY71760.1 sulfate ABC transporter [Geobacter sulfurreducens]UTG94009.1 sulfate ABC transporter ATP-binding protein [Geobacter sulfurreducens]